MRSSYPLFYPLKGFGVERDRKIFFEDEFIFSGFEIIFYRDEESFLGIRMFGD
jgi:hypothetical protein